MRPSLHGTWRTTLLAGAALLLAGWVLHGPIFRALANQLIADEPCDDFRYIAITAWNHRPGGYGCYDTAAGLYHANPGARIVIVRPQRTRLVQTGILPSFELLSRGQLASPSVPAQAVMAMPGRRQR